MATFQADGEGVWVTDKGERIEGHFQNHTVAFYDISRSLLVLLTSSFAPFWRSGRVTRDGTLGLTQKTVLGDIL